MPGAGLALRKLGSFPIGHSVTVRLWAGKTTSTVRTDDFDTAVQCHSQGAVDPQASTPDPHLLLA